MKVNVLALDGAFDTGLSTLLDAFGTANELAELSEADQEFLSDWRRHRGSVSLTLRNLQSGPGFEEALCLNRSYSAVSLGDGRKSLVQ